MPGPNRERSPTTQAFNDLVHATRKMARATLRAQAIPTRMETADLRARAIARVVAEPVLTPLEAVNSPPTGGSYGEAVSDLLHATRRMAEATVEAEAMLTPRMAAKDMVVTAIVQAIQMAVLTRLMEAISPASDGGDGAGGVEQRVGPRRRPRPRSRSPRR